MTNIILSDEFFIVWMIGAALLGLCLGSFATALIYRIPRDIPWIWNSVGKSASRSQCPSCGAKLDALDLVPVFSWVFSKGRCRHCKNKIPAFYPLVEIVCLCLVMGLFAVWGAVPATIPVLLLVPFLVAIIMIDWQYMIIPDDLNIAVFCLGLLFAILSGNVVLYIAAGILLPAVFALVSVILEKWKGRKALGMGDVKFLAGAGLFIGVGGLSPFLFFSGAFGLLTALWRGFSGKKGAFPFGPALVLSLLLHLFLTGIGFDYKGLVY